MKTNTSQKILDFIKKKKQVNGSELADVLKRHCEIQDPSKGLLVDAHVIIGYDNHIEEKLKRLDAL